MDSPQHMEEEKELGGLMGVRPPLTWVGSKCRHIEPVGTEADYRVGDSEPCAHCDKDGCVAEVVPAAKFNVDLSSKDTPPLLRLLAEHVRQAPPDAIMEEARNQWPAENWTIPPRLGEDATPEAQLDWAIKADTIIESARMKLVAAVVGVAMGVTRLNAPPKLVPLSEAARVDAHVRRKMNKQERAKDRDKLLEERAAKLRARKRKAERQARKRNRK